jgi:O-antigen/teichoic acid export membrane protein
MAPADDVEIRGLGGRAARGLTWTMVEIWGRQGLNLVVFILLAHLLTPADFGLVAFATVFVGLAQVVVDQGLGDALIQRRELSRSHIDTAFWVAIVTGLMLTLIGLALAIPVAAIFSQPALGPILQVLSLTFALSGFSSIQIGLLRRELAFSRLAVRTLAATLGGGLVGISLAYLGFGAWALVGQQVTSAALSVLTLWRVSPWRPSLHFSAHHFRELFSFGINVVGSDVLNFVGRNADNLLIGAFLGTTPLGIYAVAYRILDATQTVLINVALKITFPVFARLQHDRARMRNAYFRVTRVANAIILPGYVGLAIVGPELTVLLFGTQWTESGLVAAILYLIGPILSVQAFSNSLLLAAGHPDVVLRFRFVTTVTNVAFFAVAVPFGIVAVAVAFVVRGYLLLPVILSWMRRYAGIPVGEYLAQFQPAALATLAMAAAMLLARFALAAGMQPAAFLVVELGVGLLTYAVALRLFAADVATEVVNLGTQALPGARLASRRWRGNPRAADELYTETKTE